MSASASENREPEEPIKKVGGFFGLILELPFIRGPRRVLDIYGGVGGSLLAEGLAYSALVAGLLGVLFSVGLLGYLIPDATAREKLLENFTGSLAPFVPTARNALLSVSDHAGAFSIFGLAGLAWGASHFYGALDQAIARLFDCVPARGFFDRILRGFVSVLLLVGGLIGGIALATLQAAVRDQIQVGEGEAVQTIGAIVLPVITAAVAIAAVAIVYRVVPNTTVPIRVLWLPSIVVGLILTACTELLVLLAPLLTGGLSVFGGVATIFAALAWLSLAFQVLLIGAAWTRVRLDSSRGRAH